MQLAAARLGRVAEAAACTPHLLSRSSSTRLVVAPSRRVRAVAAASSKGSTKRSKSPVSEGLIAVLKDELKVEKERYRTPEAVLDGPPGGYELQDRPNCTLLLLAQSFGDEDVFVEVDINSQEDAGEDEDEDDVEQEDEEKDSLPAVVFSVNISKEDSVMTFSCEADGSGVSIRHVSLDDAADTAEDEDAEEEEDEEGLEFPPYTGPVFDELDDTLQQAFTDYLEERGINDEFGWYLMELVHDKLEVEYMNWLERARHFVSS